MWLLHAPGEVVAYHMDWTDWLEPDDALVTSEWEITPNDGNSPQSPTLDYDETDLDYDDDRTTVRVSGLELGKSYQLRNTITTEQGQTGEREITIRCARS